MSEEKVKKPSKPAAKKATTSATVKAKTAPQTSIPKVAATNSAKPKPTHEQIAALAHKFYVERGSKHGFHEQDWHRAVRELTDR